MSESFEDFITRGKVEPFHIHDIGHNIKNSEASLETGTHVNGRNTYKRTDIAVALGSVKEESYLKLNADVSHKTVLQFEKQGDEPDESAFQQIPNNITVVCCDVQNLVKTYVYKFRNLGFWKDIILLTSHCVVLLVNAFCCLQHMLIDRICSLTVRQHRKRKLNFLVL